MSLRRFIPSTILMGGGNCINNTNFIFKVNHGRKESFYLFFNILRSFIMSYNFWKFSSKSKMIRSLFTTVLQPETKSFTNSSSVHSINTDYLELCHLLNNCFVMQLFRYRVICDLYVHARHH
jgi:hypothetical protein